MYRAQAWEEHAAHPHPAKEATESVLESRNQGASGGLRLCLSTPKGKGKTNSRRQYLCIMCHHCMGIRSRIVERGPPLPSPSPSPLLPSL
jgi:hypothetical protein